MKSCVAIIPFIGLTGCAAVGPDYRAPTPALPAQYTDCERPAAGEVALTRWWTSFHEPDLDAMVAKSLAANRERRLALARLAEARAARGLVDAQRGPAAAVGVSAASADIGIPPYPSSSSGLYEADFDASWEVDIWGAVRRSREGALAEVEAAQLDVVGMANTVAAEVVRGWLELRYLQAQQELAAEGVRLASAERDLIARKYTAGLATQGDMAGAEAAVAAASAALPPLASAAAQVRHGLAVLSGEAAGAPEAANVAAGPLPSLPGELMVGVPADLLRRRPDLQSAERRLAAATARVGVAQADLYPRLSLDGFFVILSNDVPSFGSRKSMYWWVGPDVRWTLLDWGRVKSSIKVADARVEQALVAYEEALLLAQKDVADALSALEQERRHAAAVERRWAENRKSERIAAELRQRGLVDESALIGCRQATLVSAGLRLETQFAELRDTVALAKALGGGWEPSATMAPSKPASALTSFASKSTPFQP